MALGQRRTLFEQVAAAYAITTLRSLQLGLRSFASGVKVDPSLVGISRFQVKLAQTLAGFTLVILGQPRQMAFPVANPFLDRGVSRRRGDRSF